MSGLTLGLMSLDNVDLEVLKRSGTPTEKAYASKIMPVGRLSVCRLKIPCYAMRQQSHMTSMCF